MNPIDANHLIRALTYLLRQRSAREVLEVDALGWVQLDLLIAPLIETMGHPLQIEQLYTMHQAGHLRRFELKQKRIRLLPRDRRGRNRNFPPDILYHATTVEQATLYAASGLIANTDDRPVFFSTNEAQAWRVAHRFQHGTPELLYIDTIRARKHGSRFYRNRRNGLFFADSVDARDAMNLSPRFAEQFSAGGIPLALGPDGSLHLALIRVARGQHSSWEVAKGKLELGETPESTAIREVQEEMGVDIDLKIIRELGVIRYGFIAPGALPRLKTVFLYLMRPMGPMETFKPASDEGIGDVRWFSAEEACKIVHHSSLRPLIRHAKQMLESGLIAKEDFPTLSKAPPPIT